MVLVGVGVVNGLVIDGLGEDGGLDLGLGKFGLGHCLKWMFTCREVDVYLSGSGWMFT